MNAQNKPENRPETGRPDDNPEDAAMAIDSLSTANGLPGAKGVAGAIRRAGEATGVEFDVLYNMARRESSLNPAATAKTSSAAGLFQFIEQTWLGAVKKYGARHGLAAEAAAISQNADGKFSVADDAQRERVLNFRFDPAKAAGLAGELVNENRAGLERRLGRAVNAAEIYAAHFLGVGGAAKLLAADADASAADLLPAAANANRPVFFDGARARSTGEVMASIAASMGVATMPPANAAPASASVSETAVKAAALDAGQAVHSIKTQPRLPDAPERKSFDFADLPLAARSAAAAFGAGAGGPSLMGPMLSPLAIAVLQALDPTRLATGRDERLDLF